MDNEVIKVKHLFFLFLVLLSMNLYSQELYTKKLNWEFPDSTDKIVIHNREEIIKWSKNNLAFSTAYSKDLFLKDCNIYIVMVDGCSGIACWKIYIFKEEKEFWELMAISNARLIEQIEIEIKDDKIIFKTKSGQIGELPFEALNLRYDKKE